MIVRRKKTEEVREQQRQALWRQLTVRYRADGHIRFDLPAALCEPAAAGHLAARLREVEGIYRVTVFAGQGKLSIRWMEDVCDLGAVVRTLAAIIGDIAEHGGEPPPRPSLLQRVTRAAPLTRLKERYAEWKGRAEILGKLIALKNGGTSPLPVDVSEWAMHFANDLVAFYLIRMHWDRIIGQWLPRPWTFRYQWLTVIYLTFLLVRFRKASMPKAKK
jgi:hypothetical protein